MDCDQEVRIEGDRYKIDLQISVSTGVCNDIAVQVTSVVMKTGHVMWKGVVKYDVLRSILKGTWAGEFLNLREFQHCVDSRWDIDSPPPIDLSWPQVFFWRKEMRGMTRDEGYKYWLKYIKEKPSDRITKLEKELTELQRHIDNHSDNFEMLKKVLKLDKMEATEDLVE